MTGQVKDKTLADMNRTLLNFQRAEIENVLPDFFPAEYPNLITLFEKYYEWMDSDGNPNDRIKQLYSSRDATQVPSELLDYLEDELLLGNSYFGGFLNKREAIKFSNTLYRSKGTKYSLQQFFRAFFGVDPDISYPKENIFRVGPQINFELDSSNTTGLQIEEEASVLGPESRKYITDDKLYQDLAILIRSPISVRDWLDVYKLFVHPAGIYIGSEILIVSENENPIQLIQEEVGDPIPENVQVVSSASFDIKAYEQSTLLVDSDGTIIRQTDLQMARMYTNLTVEEYGVAAANLRELLSPNASTLDDSAGISDSIRDGYLMSDSDLGDSSIGVYDGSLVRKASFDQNTYYTEFDSA